MNSCGIGYLACFARLNIYIKSFNIFELYIIQ